MNTTRRNFLEGLGLTAGALAFPGCFGIPNAPLNAKIALQLYSIRTYIGGKRDKQKNPIIPAAGLEKTFQVLSDIGFRGVEFAGYYGNDAKTLRKMLGDNGLVACGTHVDRSELAPAKLAATCEFNLGYGNSLLICPGGGNHPKGVGNSGVMTAEQEEETKRLCDFYNAAAEQAAKYGCRVGLHNHTWEFKVLFRDGTTYWDYFFSHTNPTVCMEQDVGWTTCAGYDPCEQYAKYPHRSPTLHAKENGMGKGVKKFDAILGQPGEPGATPVDWDRLIPVTEKDGVEWYVVECERHSEDLSAVTPSYKFLKDKGLN